jgi:hypothetical protein
MWRGQQTLWCGLISLFRFLSLASGGSPARTRVVSILAQTPNVLRTFVYSSPAGRDRQVFRAGDANR